MNCIYSYKFINGKIPVVAIGKDDPLAGGPRREGDIILSFFLDFLLCTYITYLVNNSNENKHFGTEGIQ